MPKTFEIVRPYSLTDANYADFEYLLRWIGRDGSDYVYMFYDAEFRRKVKTDVINQEHESNIEGLILKIEKDITMMANDLSQNDLLIISQLFESKRVTRIKKDGTKEYYAPDSNSFKYKLKDGRYDVEFTLIMPNDRTWR